MADLGSHWSILLEIVLVLSVFLDTKISQSLETACPETIRDPDCGNAFRPSAGPDSNTMAPDDA